MTNEKKNLPEPYVRMNSRISREQRDYVRRYAKRFKISEGEAYRLIIDTFINLKEN